MKGYPLGTFEKMKNFSNDFFERLSNNLFSENLFKEVIIEIFPKNCEKSKGTPLEFFNVLKCGWENQK